MNSQHLDTHVFTCDFYFSDLGSTINLVWIPQLTDDVGILTFVRVAKYSWGFLIRTIVVCECFGFKWDGVNKSGRPVLSWGEFALPSPCCSPAHQSLANLLPAQRLEAGGRGWLGPELLSGVGQTAGLVGARGGEEKGWNIPPVVIRAAGCLCDRSTGWSMECLMIKIIFPCHYKVVRLLW